MQKIPLKYTLLLLCTLLLPMGCADRGRKQEDTASFAQARIHVRNKQYLRAVPGQRLVVEMVDQTESPGFCVTDNRCGMEKIHYDSMEAFLKENGFAGTTSFYQYYDEDSGALALELYYDEATKSGGGVFYGSWGNQTPKGFLFHGMDKQQCDEQYESNYFEEVTERAGSDPFLPVSSDGCDAARDTEFENYQEEISCADSGKPLEYRAWGFVDYVGEKAEGAMMDIVRINWEYRADGSLKSRNYYRNENVYGFKDFMLTGFYDTQERMVYEQGIIMNGYLHYYYIYSGDSAMPDYYLFIDEYIEGLLHVNFLAL